MNNRQLIKAQFGKRDEKRRSLSMLLSASDLPGDGWNLTLERSWRVGMDENSDEPCQRAKKQGLFAAMRTFGQANASRWVYVKIIPMVSVEDALLELPKTHLNVMVAPRSDMVLQAEQEITHDFASGLANATAFELTFASSLEAARCRYVVGNLEHVVALICCSDLGSGWSWGDFALVSSTQVQNIRSAMNAIG